MASVELSICVGSSCHLKGSRDVIEKAREEIIRLGLQNEVTLKAAFCLGQCGHDGVSVKVGEKVVPGVKPETVSKLFEDQVLPLLGK